MLLIFPSIDIRKECCIDVVHSTAEVERNYSIDPVEMAILWRGENAKTLHVIDRDGIQEGKLINGEVIRRMVQAVDIPVQVGGGLRTLEEIEFILNLGVYRIVIGTMAAMQPDAIEHLVKTYGSRKIAVAIFGRAGHVWIHGGQQRTDIGVIDLARRMDKIGVSRIVYHEQTEDGATELLPLEMLKQLATSTNIRISCWGGVQSYKDLVQLQSLERFGVDSVILGRPLYENRFPCQALWRMNENKLVDLGPTRRI